MANEVPLCGIQGRNENGFATACTLRDLHPGQHWDWHVKHAWGDPDYEPDPALVLLDEETQATDASTGGSKGQKQAQLGAIDPLALMELAKVAGFGSEKYERYNFMRGYPYSWSFDAMMRHLLAYWSGQDRDDESGLFHLAHAMWHCGALLTFTMRERGTDDRPA